MAVNDKFNAANHLMDDTAEDNSGEDEEEELRDEHQKPLIDNEMNGEEKVIPLSIGKIKIFKPRRRNRFLLKKYLKTCSLISVIIFFIIYLYRLRDSFYLLDNTLKSSRNSCDRLKTTLLWNKTFPMLTIESALRLIDVDNDTVLDVIVPFGSGLDASYYDYTSCQIYFNHSNSDTSGCGGGVMAVNGLTGQQMWVRYTPHELFASNCNNDINGDGIKDCILGGRMATLFAISGSTGDVIWSINPSYGEPVIETSNFYTPLYIPRDIDSDGVPDIVVIHGGDPLRKPNERTRIPGRILIMSSQKGEILSWSLVPDSAESYYSPQLLIHPDNSLIILYGTGGETHAGGLYAIAFDELYSQRMNRSRVIYKDCCKGIMVPPVLIDINDDNIPDIIMSLFNSTVIAFDGLEFKEIWRKEFPNSETYSTPAVGYFNDDSTPDFGVLYQYGPGFPIYYSAQFTVLDGKTGKQLLKEPIDMLIGTQSSPLSISTSGANDMFLFWYSSCQIYENQTSLDSNVTQDFKLAPGTTVHDNSRADFCKLRFNSTLFTQFRALSPTNTSILYDSRDYKTLNSINYTEYGLQWIKDNMSPNNYYESRPQYTEPDPQLQQQYPQQYQNQYQEYQNKQKYPYSDGILEQSYDDRPLNYDRIFYPRRRYKRHVGVHDGEGIQRVISTGTLAPPLNKQFSTIDVIFGTFWFPPSKKVRLLSPQVEECIARYMEPQMESQLRLQNSNSYFKRYGFDHDSYEEAVREICAEHNDKLLMKSDSQENSLVKDMGEMTLFRLNLQCISDHNNKVPAIKPYDQQLWPSYMGPNGDSVANPTDFSLSVKI